MHHPTDRIAHDTAFVNPEVEQCHIHEWKFQNLPVGCIPILFLYGLIKAFKIKSIRN